MKIKLDENLPLRLATQLEDLGHDVHTVRDEGRLGHADAAIWEAAQSESRFLITQDLDFSDLRAYRPGSHCGILLIRLRSPHRANLGARVQEIFLRENVEKWSGCFVVATERKIRVLAPPEGLKSAP
jgi:predicted nuclease of predicted toxin-antitoxin system